MEPVADKLPEEWLQRAAVIVAAHPDDEAIGLGTLLPRLRELRAIVHVTDGAPRSGEDIRKAGVATWQEYAQLRRREFQTAMRNAGISDNVSQISLACPDQQASFRMEEIACGLRAVLEDLRPEFVFTHPYEGGHPDHDATAMAVHCAARLLRKEERPTPIILEFASYHAGSEGMETGCFLSGSEGSVYGHALTEEEMTTKKRLFECYVSQRDVLQYFPIRQEPLRVAPRYDFTRAAHPGKLYYENFSWGVTGERWRELAAQAQRELYLSAR